MCKHFSYSYSCGCIAPPPNDDRPVITRCRSWKNNKQDCKPSEIEHQVICHDAKCNPGGCPGWQAISEDFEDEQYRDELKKEREDAYLQYVAVTQKTPCLGLGDGNTNKLCLCSYGTWKGEAESSQEYYYHHRRAQRPRGPPNLRLQPYVAQVRWSSRDYAGNNTEDSTDANADANADDNDDDDDGFSRSKWAKGQGKRKKSFSS